MQEREVVFCHPVRTAIGTFNGTLKTTPATELGAAWFARRCGARASIRRGTGSVVMGTSSRPATGPSTGDTHDRCSWIRLANRR